MIEISTGDFRELSQDLADDSVDLVLTDPPYPKEFLPLWENLGRVAARVLKPGDLLVTYTGQLYLEEIRTMLAQHLEYYWQLILSQPGGQSRVTARAIFQSWKPVLIYAKRPLERRGLWGPDAITSPTPDKNYHCWGQPLGPVRKLVERFSEPGDLVLDPFLGGGTTAVACLQTGRRCIGYEIDPHVAEVARRRIERERLFAPRREPMQLDLDTAGRPRCAACGAVLAANGRVGRRRRYCNNACKQFAFRNRRHKDVTK